MSIARSASLAALFLSVFALACGDEPSTTPPPEPPKKVVEAAPGAKVELPPLDAEKAPAESPRVKHLKLDEFNSKVDTYFAGLKLARIHIQTDKPLYKPGETIWLRTWDLQTRDLASVVDGFVVYELVSPKGAIVEKKRVQSVKGYATNDFMIPAEAQGGEYKIRVSSTDGARDERALIISTYEAPRIQKKLDFVRKAYGPGDLVAATLELKRATGEPLADKTLTAVVMLDGVELPRVSTTTNKEGGALVKVQLPADISAGDGLLTVLVDDGGVTESISRAVPIVLKKLQLSFFPEGGRLVTGLESRVYFEGKTVLGKPADIEGNVVDDQGQLVAQLKSHKEGLGRFTFIPATGRTYKLEVTKPVGVIEKYALPIAVDEGCVLRSYDDLDGALPELRVGVTCSDKRTVIVAEHIRDNPVDAAAVDVVAGKASVVHLKAKDASSAMGVARVTVFDEALAPLAERIVFRNRRARLDVKIEPNKASYAPRDQVALSITTSDGKGKPIPAELALAVVDDTVISFADDKSGHMLARIFLEPELPGGKIEEPNFFFDLTEDKSALALDLLLGARGFRTFEWAPIFAPPPPPSTRTGAIDDIATMAVAAEGEAERPRRAPPPPAKVGAMMRAKEKARDEAKDKAALKVGIVEKMAAAREPDAAAPPPPPPAEPVVVEGKLAANKQERAAQPEADAKKRDNRPAAAAKPMPMSPPRQAIAADEMGVLGGIAAEDMDNLRGGGGGVGMGGLGDLRGGEGIRGRRGPMIEDIPLAAVRVFPAPVYGGTTTPEVRTDFRETIAWIPQVKTGTDGKATVTFYLSDAVAAFRVFAEGAGGGRAAHAEKTIQSKLPFSMSVKLPTEVSAGDKIVVPLTLSNEQDGAVDVDVTASFGELLTVKTPVGASHSLKSNARDSMFYDVDVTGLSGKAPVAFSASGSGLKDEFNRELVVTPRGFPMQIAESGTVKDKAEHVIDTGAAVAGTITASVRFYPSPTSTLLSGLEGMLQEPSGCFEQTSSTNYPNVMILSYLMKNNVAAPDITARAQRLIDSGYKRLTGFETPEKGYEWFGGAPGHEALSAYGLLEFMDMKGVYSDVDDAMMVRTAEWLKKRRDGKGGFERNPRALDSFGGAAPEVTNAYIVYALAEAGLAKDFSSEIEAQEKAASSTSDAYLLALAANTFFAVDRQDVGKTITKKLVALQEPDGSFTKANHSVTRSGGNNLTIETTSLAVMAMIKAGGHDTEMRKSIDWMMKNRGGYGQWGATQATVLALKAFIRYVEATKKTQGPGSVIVQVNGKVVGKYDYEAGHKDPILIENLGPSFTAGKNTVKVLLDGSDALPYTVNVEFRSARPATSEQSTVDLSVKLAKSSLPMGETVRADVTVTNKKSEGQPMTIARIGIPGGLGFQTWQLKKLKEDGLVAFWETRAREVILYFRDLKPNEVKKIPIDLVANVPGQYEGPASSAYLYYTDEFKTWGDPLSVTITR